MTDYFEVHERDSAARVGELRLADSVTTPALVDDVDTRRRATADTSLLTPEAAGLPSETLPTATTRCSLSCPSADSPPARRTKSPRLSPSTIRMSSSQVRPLVPLIPRPTTAATPTFSLVRPAMSGTRRRSSMPLRPSVRQFPRTPRSSARRRNAAKRRDARLRWRRPRRPGPRRRPRDRGPVSHDRRGVLPRRPRRTPVCVSGLPAATRGVRPRGLR